MTYRLYTLSEWAPNEKGVHEPIALNVRLTDGADLDRTVVHVTVGEHGGVTINVAEGVVIGGALID